VRIASLHAPVALTAAALCLWTCAGPEGSGAAPEAPLVDASDAGPSAPACPGPVLPSTDGRIAASLDAIDRAEVVLEQSVRDRLATPAVIAFAEKTVTDHTLLDMQLRGAVRADQVPILSGTASDAIADQAWQAAEALGALQGDDLDRAYVAHELLAHLQELALLDRVATPNARDVRLRAAVAAAREIAATHVGLAAALQQQLDSSP
jgi:predicted outer membrane protein